MPSSGSKTRSHLLANSRKPSSATRLNTTVSGVICGHIHWPVIRKIGEIEYYNTGDWVESSSALVEDFDGKMHLLRDLYPQHHLTQRTAEEPELLADVEEVTSR